MTSVTTRVFLREAVAMKVRTGRMGRTEQMEKTGLTVRMDVTESMGETELTVRMGEMELMVKMDETELTAALEEMVLTGKTALFLSNGSMKHVTGKEIGAGSLPPPKRFKSTSRKNKPHE
jgi:hypothetical protein